MKRVGQSKKAQLSQNNNITVVQDDDDDNEEEVEKQHKKINKTTKTIIQPTIFRSHQLRAYKKHNRYYGNLLGEYFFYLLLKLILLALRKFIIKIL